MIHISAHTGAAAEVFIQRNGSRERRVQPIVRGVAVFLCHKDLGHGQTKAVNALLHIAHHEAVATVGQKGKKPILRLVGVLILVHQNLRIAPLQLAAQCRCLHCTVCGFFHQQVNGKVLNV